MGFRALLPVTTVCAVTALPLCELKVTVYSHVESSSRGLKLLHGLPEYVAPHMRRVQADRVTPAKEAVAVGGVVRRTVREVRLGCALLNALVLILVMPLPITAEVTEVR